MRNDPKLAEQIYTDKLLKPETETFLTAEWDEMVPFPNSESMLHLSTSILLVHG
jgi:hypothetical protein